MAGVDDRVVSMKFDNGSFQDRMSETIKSLDKLRQSLNFGDSTKGMNDLNAAAKNVNLAPMAAGADGVSAKFLAMSTIAITALASITLKAIDAGAQMVKSLTLAPIMDGFREYEVNMNSIQTILANTKDKGGNLESVNAALDKLNEYSDQTIYNFSEMARNIGTFTAAGVGLDDSVNAIKGIANLAAISGSNSQQASTAMYQLSQALAAGKVSLMDWNSVVNAGMGGEVFKKALFETGKAMGTITNVPLTATFEEWEKVGGTFREQLQNGAITADVLKTTLGAFSGDLDAAALASLGFSEAAAQQMIELGKTGVAAATEVKTFTQLMSTVKESVASGWSASFRLIFGDFEQAKKLFTGINNFMGEAIGKSADRRNALLQGWQDFGGRDTLIEGLRTAVAGLGTIIKPIAQAFRDIFPPMTVERLLALTAGFSEFAKRIRISGDASLAIKDIFRGVFSVFKIGVEVVKGVIGVFGDIIGSFSGAGGGALQFAGNVGEMVTNLQEALVAGGGIRDFFDRISEAIQNPIKFIKEFSDAAGNMFANMDLTDGISGILDRLADRFGPLAGLVRGFGTAIQWAGDRVDGLRNALETAWGHLRTWFSELGDKLGQLLQPSDFDGAVDAVNVGLLGGIALMLRNFFSNGFNFSIGEGFLEKISEGLDAMTGSLRAMQADLRAKALMKIAAAIGIMTISIVALSMIDSVALTRALVAIGAGFAILVGVMAAMDRLDFGLGAIKMGGLATGMILIAGAMVVLSVAIKNLSGLGWEELAKGLTGVGIGLGIMVIGVNAISTNTGALIRAGIGMGAIAVALLILSEAVKSFSDMSWGEMAKGMVGIGVGLGIIIASMWLMPPWMFMMGAGMILLAGGLLILAKAVEAFADISWGDLAKGFVGIGVGLTIIAGAMRLMPTGMVAQAAGLLVLSVALNVLALAVQAMGGMALGEMAKGLGALAISLGILAVSLNAMNGTAAGAAALLIAAGALVILTGVLLTLSTLNLGELAIALGAIAGVMIILGGSAIVLGPLVPVLQSLGFALATVGAAFALFGVGAFLVATAFEKLAEVGLVAVKVVIAAIEEFITALPRFVGAFAASLGEMAAEVISMIPTIVKVFHALLVSILDTIIEVTPKLVEAFGIILSNIFKLVRDKLPEFIETGWSILRSVLDGISNNIGKVVTTVGEIIVKFLTSMTAQLPKIIDKGSELIVKLLEGVTRNLGKIVDAGVDMVVKFLEGIGRNAEKLVSAGADMVIDLMNGIANTIRSKSGEMRQAGLNIIGAMIDGMTFGLSSKIGSLKDKVLGGLGGIVNGAKSLLGIRSPSKVFMEMGRNLMEGLAIGVSDSSDATNSAVLAAEKIVRDFNKTLTNIQDPSLGMDISPTITPVLDLTKVQAASKGLDAMMRVSTIAPEVSLAQARHISTTAETAGTATEPEPVYQGPAEVTFEQNIYSPTALSTNDIYRSTKSQIALAKEELNIT